MLCIPIENYLKTPQGLPFFCSVGDDEYCLFLENLKQAGLKLIRVSDFCSKEDKFPDLDEMIDYFRTADVDYRDNKYVVVGLGEYLALRGADEITTELNRLKTTTLGNARVVLLLRGISSYVTELAANDKKLTGQGRVYISSQPLTNLAATNVIHDVGMVPQKGIKWLLRNYEDGASGNVLFNSSRTFFASIIPVSIISGAYSALKYSIKDWSLPEQFGSDELWENLLKELQKKEYSLNAVFERYGVEDDFEDDIYTKCSGEQFKNWLYFISLKVNPDRIQNSYLAWVAKETESWNNLKKNLLIFITNIKHSDRLFKKMYEERKKLLKEFPDSDIAVFIKENAIEPSEEIYRLTDNTQIERRQILSWIAHHEWNEGYAYVYPLLSAYLQKFIFDCGALSNELTAYFEQYKTQKVSNRLSDVFLAQVDNWGKTYKYSRIQTRDNAIKTIPDRKSAFLYWIDALGVEYLALIVELAKRKGLSVHVDIGRAELPSLTEYNKGFFDNWDGIDKYKEEALDDIKHDDKGGFFFTRCEDPIHLESEIAVIEKAINIAATKLAMRECKSFVIASDHGASRLAVIKRQEERYSTETGGEHSGRCCKVFEGCDLTNCVEEKGYFVLTDYGRFKGSRAANVEVHGGASLEEVLVPIITLKLKKQDAVDIRVLNSDSIQADRKKGTTIQIYISDVDNPNNISIVIGNTKYKAERDDSTHYTVLLDDIKRSKTCKADIYDGDNLLGGVEFKIKGKSGNVDSDFDSEFDDF
ncbi:MAG: BREX-4 system phosphatase PglZ [Clostridia bacterium]|nr:BREX-4 system phosphatase PglZ [Clostridia bacterium]